MNKKLPMKQIFSGELNAQRRNMGASLDKILLMKLIFSGELKLVPTFASCCLKLWGMSTIFIQKVQRLHAECFCCCSSTTSINFSDSFTVGWCVYNCIVIHTPFPLSPVVPPSPIAPVTDLCRNTKGPTNQIAGHQEEYTDTCSNRGIFWIGRTFYNMYK